MRQCTGSLGDKHLQLTAGVDYNHFSNRGGRIEYSKETFQRPALENAMFRSAKSQAVE